MFKYHDENELQPIQTPLSFSRKVEEDSGPKFKYETLQMKDRFVSASNSPTPQGRVHSPTGIL